MTPDASQGCFVSIHVSRPTLQTQLTWKELGLEEVEGLASPPAARPPSEAYAKFGTVESRMRTTLKRFTAGGDHGFRFMKFSAWQVFKDLIEPVRQEYLDLVEPFLEGYDGARLDAIESWRVGGREMATKLGLHGLDADTFVDRVVAKLERAWPHADDLRGRFGAEVRVLFFSVPGEETIAGGAVFDDVVSEARQKARETLDGFFVEAQNELRMRAVEVVRRMHAVLSKGSSISERSINPLREFVEQFRELSVMPDDGFQGALDSLVATIEARGGASGLRESTAAWGEVQDLLEDTAKLGVELAEASLYRRGAKLTDRKIEL